MGKTASSFAALTVLALVAGCAGGGGPMQQEAAPDAPKKAAMNLMPEFKVGDSFSFDSPDMTWKVAAIDGARVFWQNDGGDTQMTSQNPLLPALEWSSAKRGKGKRLITNQTAGFFPLEVGKSVKFKSTVSTDKPPYAWEFDWTCDVAGREDVSVPAGTFDTYRIECYREKPEMWVFSYAPDVRYYVRMESLGKKGAEPVSRELQAFSLVDKPMMMASAEGGMMKKDGEEMAKAMPAPPKVTTKKLDDLPEPDKPIDLSSTPKMSGTGEGAMMAAKPDGKPGYGLHLASYRKQGNADRGWEMLRKRHSAELGGLEPTVRRVDLGAKGIFYRLIAGPVASKGEAERLCGSIKARGKDYCRVARPQ